jgi:ribose-phosphate pyrophosphokinase
MNGSILFFCPQMERLARRIVAQDLDITPGEISWRTFEDGWPNVFITKERGIRRKNVAFLASFDSPADVFPQLSVCYALSRCGAQEIKIVLPYYPTGTLERGDNESQVVTAKTLARMLSATPLCRSGPVELVLYDIHTLAQRHYFGDNLVTRYKTGTKYLKARLEGMDVSIGFPDYGAYKRFRTMFERREEGERDFPMVVCEKVRDGDRRYVHVREGDPRGRHVVIVDDIIRSGATMFECRTALMEAGAAQVSLYATHGVFPNEAWRRFLTEGFANVWITDSCPATVAAVDGKPPFEVLSLDASIARVIAEVQQ